MNTSLFISSGALQAYQQKIDTSANNVANVYTPGFKRKDQTFSAILASQIHNQQRINEEVGRLTPNGIRVGYGVRAGISQIDMAQGQAMETGNPFDLMIQGKGFFQIADPVTGEVRYTRDGSFHLSPHPTQPGIFHLVHGSGGRLLDQNGNPIVLNEQYEIKMDPTGRIQLKNKNGDGMTTISPQRIGVVDIENPHLLKNMGENVYAIDSTVLPNGTTPANDVRPMQLEEIQLSSGYLEGSNVNLVKEMTDLMAAQRSFQLNARAVSYADQMMGIANNILK
ncbi:flagellar hook-basal body protein [Neobacillus thermocopriae]|uniref:flagellar hook-basal body protein n=1 Tax=Neobacillus thermocopriae TaxID=1215031 RepID=UPI002E1D83D6|nr:flagellar hook-basal body protein [Neobacillus thermocopriae]MED3713787.1 flagellar hook-basal body protein [Neobacillus thermocopriae]